MTRYVLPIIIVCLLCGSSCRSNRQEQGVVSEASEQRTTNTATRSDSARVETARTDSVAETTHTDEYLRTTTYRDDGTVSGVQEQWRRSGSVRVATGTGQSSAVLLTNRQEQTESQTTVKRKAAYTKRSQTDSRLVQGWEWLLLPIGIAAAILFIIVIIKRKK